MPVRKPAKPDDAPVPAMDTAPEADPIITETAPFTDYPHGGPHRDYDDKVKSDFWEFVRNLPPDAPYDLLPQLPFHRGFVYKIEETGIDVFDQSILVRFQIMIGRNMDDLRHWDTFSIQIARNTVAPSMVARSIMQASAIYTVFGRMPPEAPPMPVQEEIRKAAAEAVKAKQPEPSPAPEPEPEVAPWRETAPPVPRRQPVPENLIAERTMDGLPKFLNLYDYNVDTTEAVDKLIDAFAEAANSIADVPQLRALYAVNREDTVGAIQYIQDLGTPEQLTRLRNLFAAREQQLSRKR